MQGERGERANHLGLGKEGNAANQRGQVGGGGARQRVLEGLKDENLSSHITIPVTIPGRYKGSEKQM